MKRMEDGEPQDTELLQKINDISHRMNQVNLGQESVKETIIELKDSIEGNPNYRKRTYYQTVSSEMQHHDKRGKQPRLSSEINLAYLDKQYKEILEVPKARQLRKGMWEHFLELNEAAKKWELLNYHLQVIYHDNPELDPLPALDPEVYLEKEKPYLMVSLVLKMYKHMGLVQKHHTDYKAFQSFLNTIFQGLVSAAMVYHWLTHQMYWSLCQYQLHDTQLDVLLDVIILNREFSPSAKPPYEIDPGIYHHIPELHDQEQLLSQIEMKCSDIIARHCYCIYHTDYPVKFVRPIDACHSPSTKFCMRTIFLLVKLPHKLNYIKAI